MEIMGVRVSLLTQDFPVRIRDLTCPMSRHVYAPSIGLAVVGGVMASWLAFGILERIGIAVGQWFGHAADPASSHAPLEEIPTMVGLAIVNLVGLCFCLRRQSTASGIPEG